MSQIFIYTKFAIDIIINTFEYIMIQLYDIYTIYNPVYMIDLGIHM
jgi:hypothetical protein